MEFTGEISDTDSGIILHSGSDSPTTHTKDVTTHTRAMKLKHQALQDRLENCIRELKELCIREAELTGQLSEDYPLLPGEKLPQVHRRVGAEFKLNVPKTSEDSELSLADADLALQMKICEAARKLCEEVHLSKAVRKSRRQQYNRDKNKLEQLQEKALKLRLECGRSSPIPVYNFRRDLATSDDSSLSDSVVQDEEVTSQFSQPFTGLTCATKSDPPPPPPPLSTHSSVDGSHRSRPVAPQSPLLNSCQSPCPSLDSNLSLNSVFSCDPPPIQNSPWAESSLDQPYQKSKKSHSSRKMSSPAKSEVLPPLESCSLISALPQQLSNVRLSSPSPNSTPSTPGMRVHRQLSLRSSNPESPFHKDRGRTRGPQRRLTECGIAPPPNYGRNSEKSCSIYSGSPGQEFPSSSPKFYPTSNPLGHYETPALYISPRSMISPCIQKHYHKDEMLYSPDMDVPFSHFPPQARCVPKRQEYHYKDSAVPHQSALRPLPPDIRITHAAYLDHQHCYDVPQPVVNEELESWRRRSQLKAPRSRSLDRQGAVRMKSALVFEESRYLNQKYHDQVIQRGTPQRGADDTSECWMIDDGSHFISQV